MPHPATESEKAWVWARLIASAMLFVALTDLPYGYYTLLRIAVTVAAVWSAWAFCARVRTGWAVAFGVVALVFNPIIPVYLDRETWTVIDVGAGALFLVSLAAHSPCSVGTSLSGGQP